MMFRLTADSGNVNYLVRWAICPTPKRRNGARVIARQQQRFVCTALEGCSLQQIPPDGPPGPH